MGCTSSTAARVSQSKPRKQPSSTNSVSSTPRQDISQLQVDADYQRAKNDFHSIMAHVPHLPRVSNMSPAVCFSDQAFPLLVAPLFLEEGDITNVSLPAIAGSRLGPGRIILVGQIQLLAQCTPDETDASLFLENAIRWASGGAQQIRVLLLCVPVNAAQALQKNMKGFGFRVLVEDVPTHILKVHVIITTCMCEYLDELREFVNKGGGLIVGAEENHNNYFLTNKITAPAGVAFPSCPMVLGNNSLASLKAINSFTEISKYTLRAIAEKYVQYMQKNDDEIDINELDTLITSLRYHIQAMEQGDNPILCNLFRTALNYLKRTNFVSEDGFCKTLTQNITAVLMVEMQPKLPASFSVGVNVSHPFPGMPSKIEAETVDIHIVTEPYGWASTGYYLPPGVKGEVTITNIKEGCSLKDIMIQVNAHSENLVQKPSPWSRWPYMACTYKPVEGTIDISSPFGGIVLVVSSTFSIVEFDLKLTNVMQYPIYPTNWDTLENKTVPYSEIVTKYVIFTVMTDLVEQTEDKKGFADRIDHLMDQIVAFSGIKENRKVRVIFDVELPEDGELCGYPILLHNDTAHTLLLTSEPTSELFSLAIFFAVLSLPENSLDNEHETSLAHLMACIAFSSLYPDVSPLDYSTMVLPPLFNRIWEIYNQYPDGFVRAFRESRKQFLKEKKSSFDMWGLFVQELTMKCGESFQDLIEFKKKKNFNSHGVVMSTSSQSLQNYVLLDHDDEGPSSN